MTAAPAAPEPPPAFPYQDVVRDQLAASDLASVYAALEAGLGKTMIALRAAILVEARRILTLAPALGRLVWPQEARLWVPDTSLLAVRVPVHPQDIADVPGARTTLIVVTFDMLSRKLDDWRRAIARWKPDLAIIDEAHRLSHESANRTRAVYGARLDRDGGVIETCARVWPLSGTPARNNTFELYPWLSACRPQAIQHPIQRRKLGPHEFQERYSLYKDTEYGRRVTGSIRSNELRAAIGDGMIVLRKSQVMHDLPELRFVTTPVELSKSPSDNQLSESLDDDPSGYHQTVQTGFAGVARLDLADEDLLDYLQSRATPLATARRVLGLRKVAGVIAWVLDWFESVEDRAKIIIFARHLDVLFALHRAFAGDFGAVLVFGQTPTPARFAAVDAFQRDRDCRVFIAQIETAAEMITLTRASTVVIAETEFVPSTIAQAAARAHRLGQTDAVIVHLMTAVGTLDERINAIAIRKASQLATFFHSGDTAGAES